MRNLKTGSGAPGVAILLGCIGSNAAAAAAGDHIRSGNAEIVPSVELAVEHRTNAYRQEGTASGGVPVTPGTLLRIHPNLTVDINGTDAKFNMGFGWTVRKYFQSELNNLDRFNDLDLGLGLVLLPEAMVGAKLKNDFRYVGWESESTFVDNAYVQNLGDEVSGRIAVHPGGPLELDVGGNLAFDNYRVPSQINPLNTPSLNSRLGYGPAAELKWRFFPKTAIVADFRYHWFFWEDNWLNATGDEVTSDDDVGDYVAVPDGSLWRTRVGLRGRLTEKVVLGLVAGYGGANYDENTVIEDAANEVDGANPEIDAAAVGFDVDLKGFPSGLLAEINVSFTPIETQLMMVGMKKDFQDVYFTNYVTYNTIFATYQGRFAEDFTALATGSFRFENYAGEVTREDQFVTVGGRLGYDATKFLTVGIGTGWQRRISADRAHPEVEYDNVSVDGGVTFTY